jgi:outer membrane protein assembly factor BamB
VLVGALVVAIYPGVAAAAVAGANSGSAETPCGSWPMFQGDAGRTADACSSITSSNVATLVPAWFEPTSGAVSATPTVVGGTVYDGDSTGMYYALNQQTGAAAWTFNTVGSQSCYIDQSAPYTDQHSTGFGEITSSADVENVGGASTAFVGAGGSLFAINATTGACLWAQDTDPANPTSAVEIESSPVVDTAVNPPEVLVGNDDNSSPGIAVTGLMAFNAETGELLWKYEPERDLTLTPAEFGGSDALTLSCGDGVADATYCNSTNIPDLAPNSTDYADACGDVWSSPALNPTFKDPAGTNSFEGSGSKPAGWYRKQITASGLASKDGLAIFGTGNCAADPTPATAVAHGDYVDNQTVFALDPVTGVRVWNFVEPYNQYDNNSNEPGAGDDDFGSSPMLASVPSSSVPASKCAGSRDATSLVVQGSKSGYAYGLCQSTGAEIWQVQVAQPGQLSPSLIGSVGGVLGSGALGVSNGRPTAFFTSSIPLPFAGDGVSLSGHGSSGDCSDLTQEEETLLPLCPDLSLFSNPTRLLSLRAVDAATGAVVWKAPAVPTYAAATYTNGVVFDPETTAFGVAAYDADTGTPLWAFPLGASPASAAAIVGNSVFLGSGESEGTIEGVTLPPEANGIWSFSTASTES